MLTDISGVRDEPQAFGEARSLCGERVDLSGGASVAELSKGFRVAEDARSFAQRGGAQQRGGQGAAQKGNDAVG
ncbi:MAG: hypothetical protein QME96_19145 [Myxococcota bacterium]|nr:hypothetical protein [Myxococcota bacterium]